MENEMGHGKQRNATVMSKCHIFEPYGLALIQTKKVYDNVDIHMM